LSENKSYHQKAAAAQAVTHLIYAISLTIFITNIIQWNKAL